MRLSGYAESTEARQAFERAWRAKHGSAPPPSLWPERPEDPLWREADAMMDVAWAQAAAGLGANPAFRAQVTAATWTASAGWIGCPNNHVVPVSAGYCPTCGAGPVPGNVKWEAEDQAARLGARAGLAALRAGGIA